MMMAAGRGIYRTSHTLSAVKSFLMQPSSFRCHILRRMYCLGLNHTIAVHRYRPPSLFLDRAGGSEYSFRVAILNGREHRHEYHEGSPLVVHNNNYVVNHIERPTRDI